MNFAKRVLMVAGAVALLGILGALLAPKTAHALVATLVQVANTPANPVPTSDVNEPALSAYQDDCTTGLVPNTEFGTCNLQTVPAGKRLVIEEVDLLVNLPSGFRPITTGLVDHLSGNGSKPYVEHHFSVAFAGSNAVPSDWFSAHQPTRLYVDPNQTPTCFVFVNGALPPPPAGDPGFEALLWCTLSGHLVNAP